MSLILHCGGHSASFEDICSVEVPNNTESYRAVPHGDIVRLLEDRVRKETGLDIVPERAFGLNRDGLQMFGTLNYKMLDDNYGVDLTAFHEEMTEEIAKQYAFTIGFRNSYDKSMSVGVCAGTSYLVCDNLSLWGNWFKCLKRHTKKVWDQLVPMVMTEVAKASDGYIQTVGLLEAMKTTAVPLDAGYRDIGLAMGRGILTSTQASTAIREWRGLKKEDHDHHEYRGTAFGLYQGFTEGLKLGSVPRKVDQYTGASALFDELGYTGRRIVDNAFSDQYPVRAEAF